MLATPNLREHFLAIQRKIQHMLLAHELKTSFIEDAWQHEQGGGGLTLVLEQGDVIERAAVNFSQVKGKALPKSATDKRPQLCGLGFEAIGVSVIVHPQNPFVPTSHFNVRLIRAGEYWWFGGGFDLTPYYGFVEDCVLWHQSAKDACDAFSPDFYRRFKAACDDYFYLPHRKEARGIGGIFFDDLNELPFERGLAFTEAVAQAYTLAYDQIVKRRKSMPFGDQERAFQRLRRARYVEFNLLYDRGTLFGLHSKGRTESILTSMPPEVSWRYDFKPAKGSAEEKLYTQFLPVREWVN